MREIIGGPKPLTALKLDLEWRTTALTLVLFPLLLWLGFWQLDRADEKSRIAASDAERAAAPAVELAALKSATESELAYRRVTVTGRFLPGAIILLDNQIRDGRYGHDVYGLFEDQRSGLLALLNRGWVAGDSSRRSLPTPGVPSGEFTLAATVYVPPGEPYLLAEETFATLEWPLLVQTAGSQALRAQLELQFGDELFPWELRLGRDQPAGFRRDWPVVNVSPEKHRGYALQWFTMAAALLIFFVFRSSNLSSVFRRKPSKQVTEQSTEQSRQQKEP